MTATIKSAVVFFFVALLLGCGGGDSADAEFRAARAQWTAAGIKDYQFTFDRWCYCPPPAEQNVLVIVRDGAVASANYRDGQPLSPGQFVATIDGLFRSLEEAYARNDASGRLDRPVAVPLQEIRARYNITYGYPEWLWINSPEIADGFFSINVRDFSILDKLGSDSH